VAVKENLSEVGVPRFEQKFKDKNIGCGLVMIR
jgi:hypothetical protein